jgi:hypothetical protein
MTEAKVCPKFYYYALVDGTSEVDSIAFARNLSAKKGFGGWRNLLDFIDESPFEPGRLIDGAHGYLPIYQLDDQANQKSGGIAVVCPGGHAGGGVDEMWKDYDPATRKWTVSPPALGMTRETVGRHTAAEESAGAMEEFILQPAVQVDSGVGSILSGKTLKPGAASFSARLLYVSSHGWLGGFMKGNGLSPFPAAEPPDARETYVPFQSYFQIGRIDTSGRAFAGPVWIVLAQCSTVNTATWAMWARVMGRSTPPVRGILGYEESSPDASSSVGIAGAFFANLRKKKDFLSAWRSANAGQHWAAIVHKDAHKDTLVSFPDEDLPASTLGDYIGYVPSIPNGQAIVDSPPPFQLQLFRVRHKGKPDELLVEVRPDTLDEAQAILGGGGDYVVRISATAPFSEASIRWVHIRTTFAKQFKPAQLFASVASTTAGVTVDLKGAQTITAKAKSPVSSLDIALGAQPGAKLASAGLEAHHSYLWLVASTKSPDATHDFKTIGLLYLG